MTNQRPLPDEIYTRRRVGALVILLLVVILLVWGLSALARSGSDATPAGDTESATATSTEPAPVTEPTVPEPTDETEAPATTTTATETTGTTAAAAKKGSCELSDLIITASTKHPSFPVGSKPEFFMNVKNPTDTDCVIDVGEDLLRFEVYNMGTNARVWSDTDCYPGVETGVQEFPAGTERGLNAIWSGTGSAPGQCTNREQVPAGAYYLHAVIDTNASDPAPFNLT